MMTASAAAPVAQRNELQQGFEKFQEISVNESIRVVGNNLNDAEPAFVRQQVITAATKLVVSSYQPEITMALDHVENQRHGVHDSWSRCSSLHQVHRWNVSEFQDQQLYGHGQAEVPGHLLNFKVAQFVNARLGQSSEVPESAQMSQTSRLKGGVNGCCSTTAKQQPSLTRTHLHVAHGIKHTAHGIKHNAQHLETSRFFVLMSGTLLKSLPGSILKAGDLASSPK